MSKLLIVAENVDATAATPSTGVATADTPFARGFNAVAHVVLTGVTGTPTLLLQTSPDDTTYTTVATVDAITNSHVMVEITLDEYVRLDVDAAGSAGDVSVYLTA